MNKNIKPILTSNNKALRTPCKTMKWENNGYVGIHEYLTKCMQVNMELFATAKYNEMHGKRSCAGLACNQIGYTDVSVFIAKANDKWTFFIDPVVGCTSWSYGTYEGCLSLPRKKHHNTRVVRWRVNSVQFKKIVKVGDGIYNFRWHTLTLQDGDFTPFEAQVFQHEYDHLKGTLITDHATIYDEIDKKRQTMEEAYNE